MRKALFVGSVFVAFGACAAVACSGFSSSETSDPNDANAADAPSAASDSSQMVDGDATSAFDGSAADSGRRYRVFVTSALYDGLEAGAGSIRCQELAEKAGLGGKWKAWLAASSSVGPISKIQGGPWWTLDRSKPALNVVEALDGGGVIYTPTMSIDWTETGATAGSPEESWTGAHADGGSAGGGDSTCSVWTVNDASAGRSGVVGFRTANVPGWTNGGVRNCSTKLHLYCFETE